MRRHIAGFARCNRAAVTIEYGMIAAFIVLAILVGVQALSNSTSGMWGRISAKVTAAMS